MEIGGQRRNLRGYGGTDAAALNQGWCGRLLQPLPQRQAKPNPTELV